MKKAEDSSAVFHDFPIVHSFLRFRSVSVKSLCRGGSKFRVNFGKILWCVNPCDGFSLLVDRKIAVEVGGGDGPILTVTFR
jgi:hypothetical protein